jgi:hypothetical protein
MASVVSGHEFSLVAAMMTPIARRGGQRAVAEGNHPMFVRPAQGHNVPMFLLLAEALARPPHFEPDRSFEQTVLILPTCEPGRTYTWELIGEVTGRAHGEDIQTGEDIDRPIHSRSHSRLSVRCISSSPLTLALRPLLPEGDGWAAAPVELIAEVSAWTAVSFPESDAGSPEAAARRAWQSTVTGWLPLIFPPIAHDPPTPGATWDGAWPVQLGPWWSCHGAVTAGAGPAGAEGRPRDYTLSGRCEEISYRGFTHLSGDFTRHDGGFGVQSARWRLESLWEHYMVYNDTTTTVTVTRID